MLGCKSDIKHNWCTEGKWVKMSIIFSTGCTPDTSTIIGFCRKEENFGHKSSTGIGYVNGITRHCEHCYHFRRHYIIQPSNRKMKELIHGVCMFGLLSIPITSQWEKYLEVYKILFLSVLPGTNILITSYIVEK